MREERVAEDMVAVVDADLARRVAAVEALGAHALYAFGVADVERLRDEPRVPSAILLYADERGELEEAVQQLRADERCAGLPLVVASSFEGNVRAADALALGAADFVDEDVEARDLAARIGARMRAHRELGALRRSQRTEMVLELTQALSSALDLREILYLVVRRIAKVIEVDRVSIVLGSEEADTAFVVAASDDARLRDLPIQLSRYPEIRRVLTTREPVVIDDAKTHPLFGAELEAPPSFRSLVLFPIGFADRVIGVLFLRYRKASALDEEGRFLLRAVANATGIALRNAKLLESLRSEKRSTSTARDEAERQLTALQPYVDFFQSCADGIVVITLDGDVLFCNPAACQVLGRTEAELRARRFKGVLTRDGRRRFRELQKSFATGRFPTSVDLPVETHRGRRRVMNVSFSSVLREDGVIISLRDVTEERALARELTKTKEFLQRVIDSSADAIVSADMQGNVLLFNPAAERTYGYQANEVVAKKNVRELYPAAVAREIMRLIRSDEQGPRGVVHEYQTELLGKDGTRIPVLLSAALIIHRGRPIGSVGVFRDLRAKLQIEERLADAQRELADKEQKAFIAELAGATAHELNQPLTTVMGYAQLIARELDEGTKLGRASGVIVRETERMAEIVRKIGKLTRYESKSYVGDTKIIDLERSVDSEPPVTGL
jgi:PAS domain S-box-containing protein